MNDVESMAGIINNYGPSVAILAVILVLFIVIIYNNNKALKKYEAQSIKNEEFYTETFTKITEQLLKKVMDTKESKETEQDKEVDLFDTFVKLKASMQDKCKESMKAINADRLAIYLFHDGTHSTHGIKFFKMSCICESIVVGSGIREHTVDHASVPINLFDTMIDELIKNGSYTIMRDNNIINSNHKMFLSASKINYAISIALFDNSNNILGFILAEFAKDYNEDEVNDKYKVLRTLAGQLIPILAYGDYVNININKTLQDINK